MLGVRAGQIPAHRVLFCSTLEGKTSIVRQLEPELHVDGHPHTVRCTSSSSQGCGSSSRGTDVPGCWVHPAIAESGVLACMCRVRAFMGLFAFTAGADLHKVMSLCDISMLCPLVPCAHQ